MTTLQKKFLMQATHTNAPLMSTEHHHARAHARPVMMFAVGLSVIKFISQKAPHRLMVRNFGVALMLGIAYSASIGGVGTLIGTPPNALLASFLQSTYNIQIDFFTWMKLGVPVVLVMLPIA